MKRTSNLYEGVYGYSWHGAIKNSIPSNASDSSHTGQTKISSARTNQLRFSNAVIFLVSFQTTITKKLCHIEHTRSKAMIALTLSNLSGSCEKTRMCTLI